ncbi:MAG: DUF4142 domain-containing protein [Sphingobacteriales bacterium]|nr:MAG: DUF4142 domain-containing protein [Sphingobacteriales bacterium]
MKNALKPLAFMGLAAMLTFNATAQTDNTGAMDMKKTEKMDKKTDKVIGDILGANMYQTKLLELTTQKAKDQMLKDAAAMMLPDYRKMGEELTAWASSHGYSTMASEPKKYEGKLAKWASHDQGLELDHDLGEELNDLNKDGIDLLQNAKEDTKDMELKGWIDGAVAKMKEHKGQLDALKERTKKPTAKENRPDPKMGVNNKVQY